jgi:hypothetical protein
LLILCGRPSTWAACRSGCFCARAKTPTPEYNVPIILFFARPSIIADFDDDTKSRYAGPIS